MKKMLVGGMAGGASMLFIFPLDLLRTRYTCEVG